MIRLRLSEFCNVIGEDRGAFRAVLARDHAPFNPAPPEGERQRAYDGRDLLAWMLFHRMRARGMAQPDAAEAVRGSNAVSQFFYPAPDHERAALCLFVAVERQERTGPNAGPHVVTRFETGGPGLLADMLAQPYGAQVNYAVPRPGDAPRRHLGFDAFVIVPILPAYQEARERLAAHGLDLIGPEIVETTE